VYYVGLHYQNSSRVQYLQAPVYCNSVQTDHSDFIHLKITKHCPCL